MSSCQTRRTSDQVSSFGAQHPLVQSDQVRKREYPSPVRALLTPTPTALPSEGLRLWGSRLSPLAPWGLIILRGAPFLVGAHICTVPHRFVGAELGITSFRRLQRGALRKHSDVQVTEPGSKPRCSDPRLLTLFVICPGSDTRLQLAPPAPRSDHHAPRADSPQQLCSYPPSTLPQASATSFPWPLIVFSCPSLGLGAQVPQLPSPPAAGVQELLACVGMFTLAFTFVSWPCVFRSATPRLGGNEGHRMSPPRGLRGLPAAPSASPDRLALERRQGGTASSSCPSCSHRPLVSGPRWRSASLSILPLVRCIPWLLLVLSPQLRVPLAARGWGTLT